MSNDPQTFAELQATIAAWVDRADLTDRIPEFISLAERKYNRVLTVPDREAQTTLSASAAIDLPADFWEMRAVYLDTDPRQPLQPVTPATLRTLYAAQTTGRPEVYLIQGSNMILGPSPDTTYSVIINYISSIPPLTDDNPTNWLLLKHPDLYLYGALLMAEAFIWDDQRLAIWKAAEDGALAEIIGAGSRARYGAAPLRLRPSVVERL